MVELDGKSVGAIPEERVRDDRAVAVWLLFVAALIFVMVVLGGVTRLTESGLSIVEWEPVSGILPPVTDAAWQASFEKYQATPEYQKVNRGMSLADYKTIFWFEYAHRLLGRVIGAVFLAPFLIFLWRGLIRRPLVPRLGAIFVLGGLQGALGWYMVASGLVDRPDVSHYRLAAHLGVAIALYGFILWVALDLLRGGRLEARPVPPGRAWLLAGLVFTQSLLGALVAGLDAGLAHSDWPTTGGEWVPAALLALDPWYVNFTENVTTVQFQHRLVGYAVTLLVLWIWGASRGSAQGPARVLLDLILGAAVLQVLAGILTIVRLVPVPLAAAHQAGALVLFTLALLLAHAATRGERGAETAPVAT